MLYLLMVLAALSQLETGAALTDYGVADLAACPFTYYGKTYDKLYLNMTGTEVLMCFNGYSKPESPGDCVEINSDVRHLTITANPNPGTSIPLSTIDTSMTCFIQIFAHPTSRIFPYHVLMLFYSYETEGAFAMNVLATFPSSTVEIDFTVGGKVMNSVSLPKDQAISLTYYDLSGCRPSDDAILTGSQLKYPNSCVTAVCDDMAVLQNVSCGLTGFCDANFKCVTETLCTVTGCTVIDILGKATSVQDRCVYELMTPKDTNITVLAEFRERRRRGVSFLYRLIVQKDSVDQAVVDQYGRVWVSSTLVTLTNTPQTLNNMVLYKDKTGITIKISLTFNVTIFFDGYAAQIHINGPKPGNIKGLCSNSNQLSAMKHAGLSNSNCGTQYNDTDDPTINCTLMSARCDALKGAAFNTCKTNPDPYIKACKKALCNYPAVDGLKCQFMEDYARDCKILSNITDSWRSSLSCPTDPKAFCHDRFCGPSEFCGEKASGETRCFCRAIFASKNGLPFGQSTICKKDSASVSLARCLLEDKGLDYTTLHLNNESCKAHMDNVTNIVSFGFDSNNTCGTVVTSNDTHVIYKNTISSNNGTGDIIRNAEVLIDFSCCYEQPLMQSTDILLKESSVILHIKYGKFPYNMTMKAFLDSAYTTTVIGVTDIKVNTRVWVVMKAEGLDPRIVVVVIGSCWATHDSASNATLRHDLIMNSCAKDDTVMMVTNGQGTTASFSFKTFKFSGKTANFHLHCKAHLCSTINGNNCVPNCNSLGRRRRSLVSKREVGSSALLTLSWAH